MKAARWVWVGLILEGSVMALLLVITGSGGFGHEACEGLDHDPLLLVVELLPQARLGKGKVLEEFQMQLRHGSPGLRWVWPTRRFGRGVYRRGGGDEVLLPVSRLGGDRPLDARRGQCRTLPPASGTYGSRA